MGQYALVTRLLVPHDWGEEEHEVLMWEADDGCRLEVKLTVQGDNKIEVFNGCTSEAEYTTYKIVVNCKTAAQVEAFMSCIPHAEDYNDFLQSLKLASFLWDDV